MNKITLKNFRCFHEEQTARLAPITLLVGENSTGKTSFLAMIRALCDMVYGYRVPNFKEDPYDLGSFDEIAHHRGARGGQAGTFEAGFDATPKPEEKPHRFKFTFGKKGTIPVPMGRSIVRGGALIEESSETDQPSMLRVQTPRGTWQKQVSAGVGTRLDLDDQRLEPLFYVMMTLVSTQNQAEEIDFEPLSGSPDFTSEDLELLEELAFSSVSFRERRLFSSAPVRSKPRRTYDPSRPTSDPEGDYVPMYLANMHFQSRKMWEKLKKRLENFGRDAGLFDEISIRSLGKRDSEPFQVQIRRFGDKLKGPRRNLIDVGYGVSQVLPVITELLREDAPSLFLLQQPEVHLHPSAQAALGSLFCQVAGPERQLVVETHSDHLLDRVRMDVRDGGTRLKPEDVSILFFERGELDVRIHSLRLDQEGNVLDAPEGYRKFFMEETQRSLRF